MIPLGAAGAELGMLRRVPGTSGPAAPPICSWKRQNPKICDQGGLGEAGSRGRDAGVSSRADFSLRAVNYSPLMTLGCWCSYSRAVAPPGLTWIVGLDEMHVLSLLSVGFPCPAGCRWCPLVEGQQLWGWQHLHCTIPAIPLNVEL